DAAERLWRCSARAKLRRVRAAREDPGLEPVSLHSAYWIRADPRAGIDYTEGDRKRVHRARLGRCTRLLGKHPMPGDLSLGSSDHVSVTNRTARKPSAKGRRGYHRAVTPEVAAEICRRIASGRTLLAVCRDSDMPHHDAIYDEMRRSPSLAEAIARARAESAHGLAMQVVEIADAAGPGDNPQLVKNRCDQ